MLGSQPLPYSSGPPLNQHMSIKIEINRDSHDLSHDICYRTLSKSP
jgi:hypothetical protein